MVDYVNGYVLLSFALDRIFPKLVVLTRYCMSNE